MMNSLYVLKLSDDSYYIGSTKNLDRRLQEHCNGKVKYTKSRLPAKIVYTEKFAIYGEARRREKQIKSWKDRNLIEKLIRSGDGGPIV